MNDEAQYKQEVAEFTAKLAGFARKASAFMQPDAIATALLCASIAHRQNCGWTEAQIQQDLRHAADDLQATEPPAPTLN